MTSLRGRPQVLLAQRNECPCSARTKAIEAFEALSEEDRNAIRKRGISPSDIVTQLDRLIHPRATIELERAATRGDGIQALPTFRNGEKLEQALAQGRVSAFVPASGDATRMFERVLKKSRTYPNLSEGELARAANAGDGHAADALMTLRNIKHFALWSDLERLGCTPQRLARGSGCHVVSLSFGGWPEGKGANPIPCLWIDRPNGCRGALPLQSGTRLWQNSLHDQA